MPPRQSLRWPLLMLALTACDTIIGQKVEEVVDSAKILGQVLADVSIEFGRAPGMAPLQTAGETQPVANAEIKVVGDGFAKIVHSDSSGNFEVVVPPGKYSLLAELVKDDGRKYNAIRFVTVTAGQEYVLDDPIYILDAGGIYGLARYDEVGVSDHSGITIRIDGTPVAAVSEEDGRYVLPAIPEGTYDLVYYRQGYLPVTTTGVVVQKGQVSGVPDVLLTPDLADVVGFGTVEGTVVDATGELLAGALVTVKGAAVPGVSNRDGKFTIPLLRADSYKLIAIKDGFDIGEVEVTVVAEQTAKVQIVLPTAARTGYGLVKGIVIDGRTAEPLDSSLVVADPAKNQTFTGLPGTFQLNLPTGCYALNVATGGYQVTTVFICLENADQIDLGNIALYEEGRFGGRCVATRESCDEKDNDCDGQIDEGLTCTPSDMPDPFTNVSNGEFDDGIKDWHKIVEIGCGGTRTVAEFLTDPDHASAVEFVARDASRCPGVSLIKQPLNIDLSTAITATVQAQVKVIKGEAGNGCGWDGWEYPVNIDVAYEDDDGKEKSARWQFYAGEGESCGQATTSIRVQDFPVAVTANEWVPFQSDNLKNLLPTAQRLTAITAGGNGWNYQGRIDAIDVIVE